MTSAAINTTDADTIRDAENIICNSWKSNVCITSSDDGSEDGSDTGDDEGAFDRNPFETGSGLSPWDDLGEAFEREAASISKVFPGI
jgi:hypothetical protein